MRALVYAWVAHVIANGRYTGTVRRTARWQTEIDLRVRIAKLSTRQGTGPWISKRRKTTMMRREGLGGMYTSGCQRSDGVRAVVLAVVVTLVPLSVVDAVVEGVTFVDRGGRRKVRDVLVDGVDRQSVGLGALRELVTVRGARAAHDFQVIALRLVPDLAVPLGAVRNVTSKKGGAEGTTTARVPISPISGHVSTHHSHFHALPEHGMPLFSMSPSLHNVESPVKTIVAFCAAPRPTASASTSSGRKVEGAIGLRGRRARQRRGT